jgi:hypothetical protein
MKQLIKITSSAAARYFSLLMFLLAGNLVCSAVAADDTDPAENAEPAPAAATTATNQVAEAAAPSTNVIVRTNASSTTNSSSTNSSPAVASSTNSSRRIDYQSFRIIAERNIFDPSRYGRSSRGPRTTTQRRVVRTETFGLVGSMSYEKGSFAFFDGSSSDYRKTLKAGDSIAGYQITEIAPDRVKLESAGKEVELPVGSQMRKEEGGQWTVSTRSDSFASSNGSTNAEEKAEGDAEPGSDAASDSGSGGSPNAVLQRLMQLREKELNK